MELRHGLTLAGFQEVFEPDGALVDLYVLDTSLEDWQRLLDDLRTGFLPLQYKDGAVNDEPGPLPQRVESIFSRDIHEARCLLTLDPDGLRLNCHFVTPDEIELDLAPQDIQSEELAAKLAHFLMRTSTVLGKPVLMCAENLRERPCFVASSSGISRTC